VIRARHEDVERMSFEEFLTWRAELIDSFVADRPEQLPWLLERLRALQVVFDGAVLAVFAPLLDVDAQELRARQVVATSPDPPTPRTRLPNVMPNGPSFAAPYRRERQAA
jgi:hypothetical protein